MNKVALVSPYLSIITLNGNGFNSPIFWHRVTEWIKKTKPNYMLPKRYLSFKDTHRLEVKRWKNIFHANENEKKAGVAILI